MTNYHIKVGDLEISFNNYNHPTMSSEMMVWVQIKGTTTKVDRDELRKILEVL